MVETKEGNSTPGGPSGSKRLPGHGTEDEKHEWDTELRQRVNETESDSRDVEEDAGNGAHITVSPHR